MNRVNDAESESSISGDAADGDNSLIAEDGDADVSDSISAQSESNSNENMDSAVEAVEEDEEKVSWVDKFVVSRAAYGIQATRQAGKSHTWKGVDWNSLLILGNHQGEFGFFIGYENSSHLPDSWSLHLRFSFSLLDKKGDVFLKSQEFTHKFGKDKNDPPQRYDHGSWNTFKLQNFKNYLQPVFSRGNSAEIFMKVVGEEIFTPASVPVGYDSKLKTGMVGLENLGATCYLNALLQMLYHINSFRRTVYQLPHKEEIFSTSTTLALQEVFKNLHTSNKYVTTKELARAFGWSEMESNIQQDVQEMMRVLIDKLEEKMKNTVADGEIKRLFCGKVRSFIRCINVEYESKRSEDFYDIQLDVKGCKNIYDSFKKYIEIETLEGENKYDAEKFGKQDAQKGVIFEKFPPVLTIHLKRFEFDLQTFFFKKIHDYYEFPQRLQLDDFLADDCQEEGNSPNTYILHSVLVHAGEVGGGHYYAYIRPSCQFNYANLTENGLDFGSQEYDKDHQWFKFNDEVVIQVKEREAIAHCYGNKPQQGFFRGLPSSAYMLVYIRESEAGEIMKDVSVEDIPKDLIVRLETELSEKRLEERKEAREKMFMKIKYATTTDIQQFTKYTRTQDFLSDNYLHDVRLMTGSLRLGLLLLLAKIVDTSPAKIRLWTVGKHPRPPQKTYPAYRLVDHHYLEELEDTCREDRCYIQLLDHLSNEETQKFDKKFALIQKKEQEWLNELRKKLEKSETVLTDEWDLVEGCGIGMNNHPLEELKDSDVEFYNTAKSTIDTLVVEVISLLRDFSEELSTESKLIFFKVFDPSNALPQLTIHTPGNDSDSEGETNNNTLEQLVNNKNNENNIEEMKGEPEKKMLKTPSKLGPMDSSVISEKSRNMYESPMLMSQKKSYVPIKYLGFSTLPGDLDIDKVKVTALQLLKASLGSELPVEWGAKLDPAQRDSGKSIPYRVFVSKGPLNCYEAYDVGSKPMGGLTNDDLSGNTVEELIKENGTLVIITLPTALLLAPGRGQPLLVPRQLTDPAKWLSFNATKRMFLVQKFSDRDERVMLKLKSSFTSANNRGSIKSPGFSLPPIQEPAGNGIPVGGAGLNIEIAATCSVDQLVQQVSHRMEGIPAAHLVLYPVCRGGDEDLEQAMKEAPPLTVFTNATISEVLVKIAKTTTKWYLFYKILPFGIVGPDGEDIRSHQRISEVLIADHRLRQWRGLFLQDMSDKMSQLSVAAEEEESGDQSPNLSLKKKRRKITSLGDLETEGLTGVAPNPATASIEWPRPSPSISSCDNSEPAVVAVLSNRDANLANFCSILRNAIGVPMRLYDVANSPVTSSIYEQIMRFNIEQREEMNHFMRLYSEDSVNIRNELSLNYFNVSEYCDSKYAVCSDRLKKVGDEGKKTLEDVMEMFLNSMNDWTVNPSIPLAVTLLRNGVVTEILSYNSQVSGMVNFWTDTSCPIGNLYHVGVQQVSAEDLFFFHGKHPFVHSMIIAVHSFTLLGNKAYPCDLDVLPQCYPFITYVRQDDTYETLAKRLCVLTGDEEWEKLKLAVVCDHIPFFIPMLNNENQQKVNGGDNQGGKEEKEGGKKSVWDYFCDKYHYFNEQTFEQANKYIAQRTSNFRKSGDCPVYPQLGIQRSASFGSTRYKWKRNGASGIKIV